MSVFLSLLGSLPALIQLLSWFQKKASQKTLSLAFVKAMTDAFDQTHEAKTVDDKQKAAQSLSDLVLSIKR